MEFTFSRRPIIHRLPAMATHSLDEIRLENCVRAASSDDRSLIQHTHTLQLNFSAPVIRSRGYSTYSVRIPSANGEYMCVRAQATDSIFQLTHTHTHISLSTCAQL